MTTRSKTASSETIQTATQRLIQRFWWNRPYPNVATKPLVAADDLETLIELEFPPGNIATSPEGRIFFNYHPFALPKRFTNATVFELVDGAPVPYPNSDFQQRYNGVLGMTVDNHNRLWMIEPQGLEKYPTRLLGFDLTTNNLVEEFTFTKKQSRFSQDMRVSPDGTKMYLADTGVLAFIKPRLIVLDLVTKTPRTAITKHHSVRPQRISVRTAKGRHKLALGAVTFKVGVDGISLSNDGNWLYYAAINNDGLHRIPRALLDDPSLDEDALTKHIERVATKCLNDGIDMGPGDLMYLTDAENGGIATIDSDGHLQTLVASPDVVWADGVNVAPDGSVLFTDSAIPAYFDQFGRPPKESQLEALAPFQIHRIAPRHLPN